VFRQTCDGDRIAYGHARRALAYDGERVSQISSRQHPVVKRARRLAAEREDGVVLLDGAHLVAEALDAGLSIDAVLSDGRHPDLAERARRTGATAYEATASVLEAASPVASPTGIIAIAAWRPRALPDAFDTDAPVLGLVGVQDPGNVGSAIRSADALGAGAVLILDGSADPASWRSLRGAMGSTFRIAVAHGGTADAIAEARRRAWRVVATAADGGVPLPDADLAPPVLLLLGSEGAGLDAAVHAAADETVTIPMREGANSLNVSVSAALVLWEARRQANGRRRRS